MKNWIKKWWVVPASLLLLIPGQMFMMFFVYFFASLTGLLEVGYVIGCLLFGGLAAAPVLTQILKSNKRGSAKALRTALVVILYAGLLFLSVLSFN